MTGPGRGTLVLAAGLVLAGTVGVGGCVSNSGPRGARVTPLHGPHGATAHLEIEHSGSGSRTVMFGELVAVAEDGVWVVAPDFMAGSAAEDALWFVPWHDIVRARIEGYDLRPRRDPVDATMRWRLARVSRLAPGLDESGIRLLLEHLGQDRVLRPGGPGAQPDGAAPGGAGAADFVAQAREAAERFAHAEEARLAGYRPLGPDFPGMGDHWVNSFLLMRSTLERGPPPILTYLATPDGYLFTGVAFATVLLEGEEAPTVPYPGAWHEHAGSVDEETLALSPHAAHHDRPDLPRLAMLHVWVGLDNPDGVFAQDNWAVPFVRLGLPVAGHPSPEAGKALFLASGGDTYYMGLIDALAPLGPLEREGVRRVLERARGEVEGWIAEGNWADFPLRLEERWRLLWRELAGAVPPEVWERVRVLSH